MSTKQAALTMTVLGCLACIVGDSQAATLQVNGIAPFNTSLGTLTQVVVSLDPVQVQTDSHQTAGSIVNHAHIANPPPALISGLGSFAFAPTQTSFNSSPPFMFHAHTVNIPASVNFYSGSGLNWFLNPGNTPINTVPMPVFSTSTNEGHNHKINLPPIVPLTTYTYTPIPEPASAGLLLLGVLVTTIRRNS